MFTDDEIKEFLSLFAAFVKATGLSDSALSKLLNVSHNTVNRWSNMLLNPTPTRSLYRRLADPARSKIEFLNSVNKEVGLYRAINQEKAPERLAILQRQLDATAA
jgi:transcriptional regulator with XRE-family HTH domain